MRERIEWLNYWIEEADTNNKQRILLIGDSVARDYRKPLNRMLAREGYVVDLLAFSFGIFDELFFKEIKHFINAIQYEYQYLLFNLGAHHGYSVWCTNNTLIQQQYYSKLELVFKILNSVCENVILISGTPENMSMADARNEEIETRNQILKKISANQGYIYIDLYQPLMEKQFAMVDRFHYMEDGYEYIAILIKNSIGFQKEVASPNFITSLADFIKILKHTSYIYIYGDGKRGRLLYEYLKSFNKASDRFIVSEELYQKENEEQILLNEVLRRKSDDDIVIVTPECNEIWEKLAHMNFRYYTLSNKIYVCIEEYLNAYLG